jgi:alanine or glycine:cation symporter, AGCS family
MWTGGFLGVLIQGVKRASFSNEAGIGSAAIAHAAAKNDHPVREGAVAMLGPFIDTHLVCTMTAFSILITGAHLDPNTQGKGAMITAQAFSSLGYVMPYMLTIATCIFAYSTMISWSYYGEKGTQYLFGEKFIPVYRIFYIIFVALGPILSLTHVLEFSDIMLLSMAFPNIIGMMFLSKKITSLIKDYDNSHNEEEFKSQATEVC